MNFIDNWLTTNKEELIHIASDIFCHPETAYQETYSSKRLADFLETQGFRVTWKTAGIDTAFTAVWGSGKPMLGFLAEYDALPVRVLERCLEYLQLGLHRRQLDKVQSPT